MEKYVHLSESEYEYLIKELNKYKSNYFNIKNYINLDIGGTPSSIFKVGYNHIDIKHTLFEELFNVCLKSQDNIIKIIE